MLVVGSAGAGMRAMGSAVAGMRVMGSAGAGMRAMGSAVAGMRATVNPHPLERRRFTSALEFLSLFPFSALSFPSVF